jgi:hypothetical protein
VEDSTRNYPLSSNRTAFTFDTPGLKTLTLFVSKEYPEIKASLSRTLVKTIYVSDVDFADSALNQAGGLGNLGIGGETGFEISEAVGEFTPSESFEVIVRALALDKVTQEIMLLVATSRTRDASSLLGTMALDVFPLVGRPHMKELIRPSENTPSVVTVSPLKVATQTLSEVIIGKPIEALTLQASGGMAPYSWYCDNLPNGLSLSVDGTLEGMILEKGIFTLNIAVKDSNSPEEVGYTQLTLSAQSDLLITNPLTPGGVPVSSNVQEVGVLSPAQVGSEYKNTITAQGGIAPYIFKIGSGALPRGLSLSPSTGEIVGTPVTYNSTTDFDTPFKFTIEISDSTASRVARSFSLSLNPMPLTIGEVDQRLISSGMDYELALPISGGRSPYTVDSFDCPAIESKVRILYPESIIAVSGKEVQPLVILTPDQFLTPEEVDQKTSYPISFSLEARGGTPSYSYSLNTSDTTLPGCSVTANGVVVGTISYQRGVTSPSQNYYVSTVVTDSMGRTATKNIGVTINILPLTSGTGEYILRVVTITGSGASLDFDPYGPEDHPYLPSTTNNNGGKFGVDTLTTGQTCGIILWDKALNTWAPVKGGEGDLRYSLTFKGESGSTYKTSWTATPAQIFPSVTLNRYTGTRPQGCEFFTISGNALTTKGSNLLSMSLVATDLNTQVSKTYTSQFGIEVGAPASIQKPILADCPQLPLIIKKIIRADLSTTLVIDKDLDFQLTGQGGVAPYSYSVVEAPSGLLALPGAYITSTGILKFDPRSINNLSFGSSYEVFIKTTDAVGSFSIISVPITVLLTVVSETDPSPLSILLNTIPSALEVGTPYQGTLTFSLPIASATITGLPGASLVKSTDTIWNISGESNTPSESINNVSFTINAIARMDSSKTISKTYTMGFFKKEIVPNNPALNIQAGSSAVLSVQYKGFSQADLSQVAFSTDPSKLNMSLSLVRDTSLNNIPSMYVEYTITADTTAGGAITTIILAHPKVQSVVNVAVSFPRLVITDNPQAMNFSEFSLTGDQTVSSPLKIVGGKAPYTIVFKGATSTPTCPIVNLATDGGNGVVVYKNVQNVNWGSLLGTQSLITFKITENFLVTDAAGNSQNVTGTVNWTVTAATTLDVRPRTKTWNIAHDQASFIALNNWEVINGTGPYTCEVKSVGGAFSTVTSIQRQGLSISYNPSTLGTALPVPLYQGTNILSVVGSDATLPLSGSNWTRLPSGNAFTASGAQTAFAVLEIKDSKGRVSTITCNYTLNVLVGAAPVSTLRYWPSAGFYPNIYDEQSKDPGSDPVSTYTTSQELINPEEFVLTFSGGTILNPTLNIVAAGAATATIPAFQGYEVGAKSAEWNASVQVSLDGGLTWGTENSLIKSWAKTERSSWIQENSFSGGDTQITPGQYSSTKAKALTSLTLTGNVNLAQLKVKVKVNRLITETTFPGSASGSVNIYAIYVSA